MNSPPIYRLAKQSAAVLAVLGGPEPRLYPWGENDDERLAYPYATWVQITGSPQSLLAGRPASDRVTTQIDVWAKTQPSAEAAAKALRDAIELDCYIAAWRSHGRDAETKLYRISFDADWFVYR